MLSFSIYTIFLSLYLKGKPLTSHCRLAFQIAPGAPENFSCRSSFGVSRSSPPSNRHVAHLDHRMYSRYDVYQTLTTFIVKCIPIDQQILMDCSVWNINFYSKSDGSSVVKTHLPHGGWIHSLDFKCRYVRISIIRSAVRENIVQIARVLGN